MSAGTWGHAGVRCRIKKGWEDAGREGDALCFLDHERLGGDWIVVIWDDDDEPECFKSAGLLLNHVTDRSKWVDA